MSQATNQSGRNARAGERHKLGLRAARLLAGAWRDNPELVNDLSETELAEIAPLLCQTGAAALAWSRISDTPLAETAAGKQLREVYRQSRLASLIHEREIVYVLSLLRAEGIEPVLVKGWAMARRYPDRALRPFGDIDLCVRPDQFARATAALKCLEEIDGHYVDLHCGFRVGLPQPGIEAESRKLKVESPLTKEKLSTFNFQPSTDNGHWTDLFARTQVAMLNGTPVRILCDEDHLRLLCQHLFRSGARRPAWVCDIALLVEMKSVPGAVATGSSVPIDWDICLGTDPLDANWIASAVCLARDLLGANIDHTPFAKAALPRWLANAVLQQWGGRVKSPIQSRKSKVKSPSALRKLSTFDFQLLTDLYSRWDNPIRATAAVGGEFNNWPRLPYRLAESIKRVSGL